jgi:hypothetical protein
MENDREEMLEEELKAALAHIKDLVTLAAKGRYEVDGAGSVRVAQILTQAKSFVEIQESHVLKK